MNERIEKLANVWANLRAKDDRLGITYTFSEKALEQFAELIVRECLDACSRANDIKHFVPPTQEQVVLSCMREIETTFRS